MRIEGLFVAALLSLAACSSGQPKVVSAVAGLPPYTAEESALFGDLLSPTVFGLPGEAPPRQDTKLAQRAERADGVVPVKVSTLSEESLAGETGYTVSLVATGNAIVGRAPDGPLELRFGPGNPSLARVRSAGATLVGRRFLLFVKRYSDGGEPALHWHGEGDTPEVRAAATSAKALDEGGNRVQTAN
jgi:hypothetical protein